MPLPNSNRNTTGWNLSKTVTFRLASAKLMRKWGTNLQNPSDNIARLYIPDKGKVFVDVDQDGAEALVVSYLCRNGMLRQLFQNGVKSHWYICMKLFEKEWDEEMKWKSGHCKWLGTLSAKELVDQEEWWDLLKLIKRDPVRYFIAKKTCHASNYDMHENTFRLDTLKESRGKLVLSKREASLFLGGYHTTFPEIKGYHNQVVKVLNSDKKILRNLFGYPREFHNLICDDKTKREAIAFIPQSTVGTITNIAYAQLQEYIEDEGKDWDLLNNKHDSYLAQVPVDESEEAISVMIKFMEQDLIGPGGDKFKMKAGACKGFNWGHYDEEYNREGMREL